MSAITSPITQAQTEGNLGYAAVFAEAEATAALMEMFDVWADGLLRGVGDLAGTGSDTLDLAYYSGLGWGEAMTAMSTETQVVAATGFMDGVDQLTIGRYALAKEVSHTQQILSRERIGTIEGLLSQVPGSLGKTIRQRLCVAGSGLSNAITATGNPWTLAKHFELANAANETEGFDGQLIAVMHPEQVSDLRDSVRTSGSGNYVYPTEFLFGDTAGSVGLNRVQREAGYVNNFLDIRTYQSVDVQASGSDHVGFAFMPGKFVFGTASSASIPSGGASVASIPQFGVVVIQTQSPPIIRFDAEAHFGVSAVSDTGSAGWKLISENN